MFDGFRRAMKPVSLREMAAAENKNTAEAEIRGQMDAINRVQAMIHFALDGTILDANENFLNLMGYTWAEIVGKHHSIFADREYAQTSAYRDFWAKLRRGV